MWFISRCYRKRDAELDEQLAEYNSAKRSKALIDIHQEDKTGSKRSSHKKKERSREKKRREKDKKEKKREKKRKKEKKKKSSGERSDKDEVSPPCEAFTMEQRLSIM